MHRHTHTHIVDVYIYIYIDYEYITFGMFMHCMYHTCTKPIYLNAHRCVGHEPSSEM